MPAFRVSKYAWYYLSCKRPIRSPFLTWYNPFHALPRANHSAPPFVIYPAVLASPKVSGRGYDFMHWITSIISCSYTDASIQNNHHLPFFAFALDPLAPAFLLFDPSPGRLLSASLRLFNFFKLPCNISFSPIRTIRACRLLRGTDTVNDALSACDKVSQPLETQRQEEQYL